MLPRWLQNILCNVSGQLYCTCGLQHSFDGLVKRRLPLHSYFNDCHSKVRACDTCTLVTLSRQCSNPKAQNPLHTPPRTASRTQDNTQHTGHSSAASAESTDSCTPAVQAAETTWLCKTHKAAAADATAHSKHTACSHRRLLLPLTAAAAATISWIQYKSCRGLRLSRRRATSRSGGWSHPGRSQSWG